MIDGYEELAFFWNRKAVFYLAGLTCFAIAVYLFGQALALGRHKLANFLGLFGGGLFIFASGLSASAWMGYDPVRSSETDVAAHAAQPGCEETGSSEEERLKFSASQYQDGKTAYELALVANDSSSADLLFKKAAAAMDCAVAARPLFAVASLYRAQIYAEMGSPQRGEPSVTLETRSNIDKIIESRERALASSSRSGVQLRRDGIAAEMGFDYLLKAFLQGDKVALLKSVDLLRKTVNSDAPEEPNCSDNMSVQAASSYIRLGLALLASNIIDKAENIYHCVRSHFDSSRHPDLLWPAFTEFNIFAKYCSRLNSTETCADLEKAAQRLKQDLINGGRASAPSTVKFELEKAWITASRVGWSAKLKTDGDDLSSVVLTVVWYALEPDSGDWPAEPWQVPHAVPALSKTFKGVDLNFTSDGTVEWVVPYLEDKSECLPTGQYTVEFYINGLLASTVSPEGSPLDQYDSYRSRALNLEVCYPSAWKLKPEHSSKPELIRSLFTDDGEPAALLWTYYGPRGPASDAATAEGYFYRILRRLARDDDHFYKLSDVAPSSLDCKPPIPAGTLLHKEWTIKGEGAVYGVILFPVLSGKDPCQLLNMVTNYDNETVGGPPSPSKSGN